MTDEGTLWDKRYGDVESVYGEEPNDFLVASVSHLPPGPVLCLADGEGRNSVWLAGQGYDVTSIDISPVGVDKAKKLAAKKGVSVNALVGDLAQFTIDPDQWSGIVSIFAHMPKAVRQGLHAQVVKGLVKGGAFVLEAYRPAQLDYATGGPKSLDLLMSLADLKEELAGLDIVHAEETVRAVNEGARHTGDGAVVQVIGIKP